MNIIKNYTKYKKHIPLIFTILFSGLFVYISINVNSDLSTGRYVLFMDEQISFDGTRKILTSKSFDELKFNIMDGLDHRYGRIFYNVLALFSYIPYKTFGDSGLIISNRIILSSLLLASYLLLSFAFIKNNWIRFLSLLLMISLPYTSYYMHQPKPEPIQLILISLFLIFYLKKRFDYSPFFILGLGLGAKVSLLPMTLFIIIYELVVNYKHWKTLIPKYFYLILGFFTAVPILFLLKFDNYIQGIKSGSRHGADDSSVSFISWLNFIFKNYWNEDNYFLIVTIFCLFTLGYLSYKSYSTNSTYKIKISLLINNPSVFLFIFSMSFLLPVILFVKRIWGFYLHIGFVLLIVSFLSCIDYKRSLLSNPAKILLFIIALMFLKTPLADFYDRTQTLSKRTSNPGHRKKISTLNEIKKFLNKNNENGPQRVCIAPQLYYPLKYDRFSFFPIWGYFHGWKSGCKFVFITKKYGLRVPKKESRAFPDYKRHIEEYKKHVTSSDNLNCQSYCFKRIYPTPLSRDLIILKAYNKEQKK